MLHPFSVPLLDQQEGEEDFSPVFDTPVNSADLQSVFGIVNLDLLVTVTALEQVPRGVLATRGLVKNTDLSILETRGVAEPVATLRNDLFHIVSPVRTILSET